MKNTYKVVLALTIILLICFAIYNCIVDTSNFVQINIFQSLSLLIALIFTFFFSQKISETNKKLESVEQIIKKTQSFICAKEFYYVDVTRDNNEIREIFLMNMRKFNNYISILEKYENDFPVIHEKIDYIKKQKEEYSFIISVNISDNKAINDKKNDLLRISNNIENCCDELIVNLYIQK